MSVTGFPGMVSFEPKGYRDVVWCPYLNEPAILVYENGEPDCPNCNHNYEPSTHIFICHIIKPTPSNSTPSKDGQ